jgi:signal transduction histidine kinase
MEGFIDDYSRVRLIISLAALAVLSGFAIAGTRSPALGITVVSMGVIAIHSGWSITSGVRNPRLSLALDMTVTTIAGWSAVNLPGRGLVLAVWCVLIPFLTYGRWRVAFYGYAVLSYLAVISRAAPPQEFAATVRTLFIAGVIVVVLNNVSRRMMTLEVQRSQLLGSVSHELRNQLTGVMGMIDLALDDAVVPSLEEVRDLIGLARREAGDAAGIIEDLLAASRMENNVLDVASEQVDVDLEVAKIVDHYPTEGMSINQTGPRSGVVALADQIRVRQVLRNLLSNAVRYGGKSISISVLPDGGKVFVRVADDGPGVPVGEEESIFLPYRRATNTRRHQSSVGLGLWVSRRLARAMGGDLTYQRESAETVFELTLLVYVSIPKTLPEPALES